ncbi:MAG TPA: DUF4397 domain-containing protein [Ignavibacteria bacterium]|nr:DUF4397 domain-containing protein [Ignavibacteria bacterium]
MKYLKLTSLFLFVAVLFSACSRYDGSVVGPTTVTTTQTKLKVINTATNFTSLSAKINNNSPQILAFENLLPYQTLPSGVQKMLVKTPDGTDSLHHENNLSNNVAYTWFIIDGAPLSVLPAVDNLDIPANGKAKVRISNFTNVDTINIKITGGDNLITGINNGAVWGYASVNSGTYNLEIRDFSDDKLLYSANGVTFSNQNIYDLVVSGYYGGTGLKEIRFTVYN